MTRTHLRRFKTLTAAVRDATDRNLRFVYPYWHYDVSGNYYTSERVKPGAKVIWENPDYKPIE